MRQLTDIRQIPDYDKFFDLCESNQDRLTIMGFHQPYVLELGPGKHGMDLPGRVKIDLNAEAAPGCEIYHDLEYGIPLPTASVGHIQSNQVLEHIWNIILLFNEMWRVLIPGGTMHHCVPYYLGPHADGDPTHVRRFSETSFQYFCQDGDGQPFSEKFASYGIKCNFKLVSQEIRPHLDITAEFVKPR